MKAKHSKRLEKLNNKFPDKVAAIARWLETLTDEEINYFVVFLFALRAWWDKEYSAGNRIARRDLKVR